MIILMAMATNMTKESRLSPIRRVASPAIIRTATSGFLICFSKRDQSDVLEFCINLFSPYKIALSPISFV